MGVTIRYKSLNNGRQSIYLDIYHNGQRWYEFLKLYLDGDRKYDAEKKRLAGITRNQREIELFTAGAGLIAEHRKKTGLVDFAKPIIEKANRSNAKAFLDYMESYFRTIHLGGVNEKGLAGFQEFLLTEANSGKGLKPSTTETYFNLLNAVLAKAVRQKLISDNPMKYLKRVRADEPMLEYLTIEEVQKLARTPIMGEDGLGGRIKRAFLFSCQTTLRWSDDRSLTWGAISQDNQGRFRLAKRQRKTGDPVYIPLSEDALHLVQDGKDVHPKDALVFDLKTKTDPNQYLEPWGVAAGVGPKLHFHLSRHTGATLLLESGVDAVVVQKILGHKKLEMTLRYAKVTDKLQRQAVDGLKMGLKEQASAKKSTPPDPELSASRG